MHSGLGPARSLPSRRWVNSALAPEWLPSADFAPGGLDSMTALEQTATNSTMNLNLDNETTPFIRQPLLSWRKNWAH